MDKIGRLRALEIELRNEAEAKQLESQDKNWSEWVRDRAHGRSAGLHEAANRIQQLIAELGQEVGAVCDNCGKPLRNDAAPIHACACARLVMNPARTSEARDAELPPGHRWLDPEIDMLTEEEAARLRR